MKNKTQNQGRNTTPTTTLMNDSVDKYKMLKFAV